MQGERRARKVGEHPQNGIARWTSATNTTSMATTAISTFAPCPVPRTTASMAPALSRGISARPSVGGSRGGTIRRATVTAAGALITDATRSWEAASGSNGRQDQ